MRRWTWVALVLAALATAPAQAFKQNSKTTTWPLPWAADTALEYDHRFEQREAGTGGAQHWSTKGIVRLNIQANDASDGYLQQWVMVESALDDGQLAGPRQQVLRAANHALKGLDVQVELDAEGAYVGLAHFDDLQQRYRQALRQAFVAARQEREPPKDMAPVLERMIEMLAAPGVVESQLSELPRVYNFVAGGGLRAGQDYRYEEQVAAPLDGSLVTMNNTLRLERTDTPAVFEVTWVVTPDRDQTLQMIKQAVDALLAGTGETLSAADLEKAREDADFTATAVYRVDAETGIVQSLEYTRVRRVLGKDQTTRTVMTLRR